MSHPEICRVQGNQRVRVNMRKGLERVKNFDEAEPTFSLEEAMAEAKRCSAASPCHCCEVCELICPDLAVTRDLETKEIVIDLDYCKGCGLCAHYCPHDAIKMVLDE